MYYLGVQRCDPLAQARRDSTVAQHTTRQPLRQVSRDEDTRGDKRVLNAYTCPNVESKQRHISAPCAHPPRVVSRPVASGGQRPYAAAQPSAPPRTCAATVQPSAPPCACTLAAAASPPDASPVVVVVSPPSARAVASCKQGIVS